MITVTEIKKPKKKINSKQKGKRGELAWKNFLWAEGFTSSYRSQQFCGSENSADVICPQLPTIHQEVKFTQQFNAYAAMQQAANDCGTNTPIVAHKKNNCEWLVVMRAHDWINMIKETSLVKSIFCPDCKSSRIHKIGLTEKYKQRYICVEEECRRSFIL